MSQLPESPKRLIQIGEAAERAALSIDAIRFYERRALLPKAPRTTGRFRLYTAGDVTRLTFIKRMQGLGFSLQEIRQLLDLRERIRDACGEVRDLLKTKLAKVRDKIRELEKLEQELALDLRKCNRELRQRQKRVPKVCPVLTSSDEKERRVLC